MMSEKSREQISALMDDEQETGSVFILSAMSNDKISRDTWNRYHLIGETMRGNLPSHIDMNLAERVSSAIENEPVIHASTGLSFERYLKPVAGFAIAATVAVVAILGVRQPGVENLQPTQFISGNQPQTTPLATVVSNDPGDKARQTQAMIDAEARLNRYLVNYNEYRTNSGVQGMLPYVRIVAHDVEE